MPRGTWNYDSQSWDWESWSDADRLKRAQDLYAAAGYSREHALHLHLLYNSNPLIKRASVALAAIWKETFGVETELTEEEYRVFLNSPKNHESWDIVRLAWMADYDDAGDFFDMFRSTSPNNDAGYANHAYDELLDRAVATADPAQRREIQERAERLMLTDYPVITLYFFSAKKLIKPYVKGARTNSLDRLHSKQIDITG